jgi:hypothetical protein
MSTQHKVYDCDRKRATCEECGGGHHTDMHADVMRIRATIEKKKEQGDSLKKKYEAKKAYVTLIEDDDSEVAQLMNLDLLDGLDNTNEHDEGEPDDKVSVFGYTTLIIGQQEEDTNVIVANTAQHEQRIPDTQAILDTGATGHIMKNEHGLTHVTPSIGITVQGITQHSIPVVATGRHPTLGVVHIVPEADAQLISLSKLSKRGCKFDGQGNTLTVRSADGSTVMKGRKNESGLYVVDVNTIAAYLVEIKEQTINNEVDVPLTAIAIQRAKDVRALHESVGHPGDTAFKQALEHGVWPNVNFTGKDVDNSNRVLGPCAACAEGKMVAPPEPATMLTP